MKKQDLTIHYEDIPKSFAVCFNAKCPMRKKCVRFAAAPVVFEHRKEGLSVFPSAIVDGECKKFVQLRMVRLAWGFKPLFVDVRHADYDKVRFAVIHHFRSESDFWRYNRGHYKLTPEEQEAIFDIFRRFGYNTKGLKFAHYKEQVFFPEIHNQ
jgi:hypothetical protein